MRLDGHIHITPGKPDPDGLLARMKEGGVDGGVLLSISPPRGGRSHGLSFKERLDNLMEWTDPAKNLFPFFYIGPLEDNALDQVAIACERGVMGFKVICHNHYPSDPKAMQVFRAIAQRKKCLFFHSGILWGGSFSGKYNRPCEFEALFDVQGARFSMAHISWPWCDELIAVYGKFQYMDHSADPVKELFIDTTPGTPPIYRRDALTKLYTVGYDTQNNVFFGTDCHANSYDGPGAGELIAGDEKILRDAGLKDGEIEKYFSGNLLRFVAGSR